MIDFALLSLPIFGVVALGWAAVAARLATAGIVASLAAFSFRFALPALIFHMMASQPLGRSFNLRFYGGYLAGGALIFALTFAASRLAHRRGTAIAGAHAATATVGNLGFLGPPLVLAFFGERGVGPLAMAILAEVLVLLSLGGALMGTSQGAGGGVSASLLRGAALNPVVAAIALGAASAATGIHAPPALGRFLSFLGSAAGPTALFAVGGALALQRFDLRTMAAAALIAATKLTFYPALVWLILGPLLQLGPFAVRAAVLLASLPSASSSYILAQRYGADADRVSAAIAISTVVSVLSVPFAAWLVRR